MDIAILTGVEHGRMRLSKTVIFCQEFFFLKRVSKMKITCMPIICFIFCPIGLNAYSFRSVLVAYPCLFPSEQGFKSDILMSKKWLYFTKKVFLSET